MARRCLHLPAQGAPDAPADAFWSLTLCDGYSWFSLSDGPAIIHTPSYDRFFLVSIFDMFHNTPGVIANPPDRSWSSGPAK